PVFTEGGRQAAINAAHTYGRRNNIIIEGNDRLGYDSRDALQYLWMLNGNLRIDGKQQDKALNKEPHENKDGKENNNAPDIKVTGPAGGTSINDVLLRLAVVGSAAIWVHQATGGTPGTTTTTTTATDTTTDTTQAPFTTTPVTQPPETTTTTTQPPQT